MRQLDAAEWRAVSSAIANDVRLSAALLAGEMPEDIERAFAAVGTSLFPASAKEMTTACSCPDWSNPCKHVAAVFYLIGEEFDRDPFLLFVLRGRVREDVRDLFDLETVCESPYFAEHSVVTEQPSIAERPKVKRARRSRALPAPAVVSPEAFWGDATAEAKTISTRIEATSTDEPAILKRAGNFPFWRANTALRDAIIPLYNDAAAYALNWLADRARTTEG